MEQDVRTCGSKSPNYPQTPSRQHEESFMTNLRQSRNKRRRSCAPELYSSSESPYVNPAESPSYGSARTWESGQSQPAPDFDDTYEIKQEQHSVLQSPVLENEDLEVQEQHLESSGLQASAPENYPQAQNYQSYAPVWMPGYHPTYASGISTGYVPQNYSDMSFERTGHQKGNSITSHMDMMSFADTQGSYAHTESYFNATSGTLQPVQPEDLHSSQSAPAVDATQSFSSAQSSNVNLATDSALKLQRKNPSQSSSYFPSFPQPTSAPQAFPTPQGTTPQIVQSSSGIPSVQTIPTPQSAPVVPAYQRFQGYPPNMGYFPYYEPTRNSHSELPYGTVLQPPYPDHQFHFRPPQQMHPPTHSFRPPVRNHPRSYPPHRPHRNARNLSSGQLEESRPVQPFLQSQSQPEPASQQLLSQNQSVAQLMSQSQPISHLSSRSQPVEVPSHAVHSVHPPQNLHPQTNLHSNLHSNLHTSHEFTPASSQTSQVASSEWTQNNRSFSGPMKPPQAEFRTSSLASANANSSDSSESNDLMQKTLLLVSLVDGYNFSTFLLRVLSEFRSRIPLDDFYNLLYNHETFHTARFSVLSESRIDKAIAGEQELMCVDVCHLLVKLFRQPALMSARWPNSGIDTARLASVNFEEFRRSFLAIKVLKDVLVPVPDSPEKCAIPRLTIYKVYFILCHRLKGTYPAAEEPETRKNPVLGQSRLGKLIKVAFPQLMPKRLGRRGHSRYNYLGVVWNKDIVTKEVIEMSERSLPELVDKFSGDKPEPDEPREGFLKPDGFFRNDAFKPEDAFLPHSFIHKDFYFPAANFDPQAWFSDSDQTSWLRPAKERASHVLASCSFDADLFMQQVIDGEQLRSDSQWLLNSVVEGLEVLGPGARTGAHLHLFLVMMLSVFCLLLKPSGGFHDSQGLHDNVAAVAAQLPARTAHLHWLDPVHIHAVCGALKRMGNIWVLVGEKSRKLEKTGRSGKSVLGELQQDVDAAGPDASSSFVLQTFVFCMNALGIVPAPVAADDMGLYKVVAAASEHLNKALRSFSTALEKASESDSEERRFSETKFQGTVTGTADIPEESETASIFRLMTRCLHETLASPITQDLPIHFVAAFVTQSLREAHKQLFWGESQRSEAAFRAWWTCLSALQEYIAVIAEIVSLVQFSEE